MNNVNLNPPEQKTENLKLARQKKIDWLQFFVKWSLIVVGLLLVSDWVIFKILSSSNQEKISAYYESIGAKSHRDYLKKEDRSEEFGSTGNAWYLYQSALGTISKKSLERYFEFDDAGEEKIFKLISEYDLNEIEAALDKSHQLIQMAAQSEFNFPILNYEDGFGMVLPHLNISRNFIRVALASFEYHVLENNYLKSLERITDIFILSQQSLRESTLVTSLVQIAVLNYSYEKIGDHIQKISHLHLEKIFKSIHSIDMKEKILNSMRSEVFFALSAFSKVQAGTDNEVSNVYPVFGMIPLMFKRTYIEWEKSHYLDVMLPGTQKKWIEQDFDGWHASLKEPRSVTWAPLSGMIAPAISDFYKEFLKNKFRNDVLKTAILFEIQRQQGIVWEKAPESPDPQVEITLNNNSLTFRSVNQMKLIKEIYGDDPSYDHPSEGPFEVVLNF